MRYSIEPREQKSIQEYEFLLFAKIFSDRYDRNPSTEAANNIVIDAAKSASKRLIQKTEEATGDMIGNTIVNKITSAGKLETKES